MRAPARSSRSSSPASCSARRRTRAVDDGPLALLDGVRVVDLTSTLSGPYGTLLLGDLGADVVKVEPPRGDPIRDIGPRHSQDMGAIFLNLNRNKRSVVLDLTS